MDLRANALAVVVVLACALVVASKVRSAPHSETRAAATAEQRAMFATNVADGEPEWRTRSEQDFPSDLWSQRDAFHGYEAQRVRSLAGGAGVPYEEVIRAVDDDLHRGSARAGTGKAGTDRGAGAVPCKPRPFYD